GAVIEDFDVVENGITGSGEGGEAVMIDQFIFETATWTHCRRDWLGAWVGPSDRAAVLECRARPPPWLRCDHCCAITPAPPSYTLRCISLCYKTAYSTVSSCGLLRVFDPLPTVRQTNATLL